jgi:hypothetical protein
MFMTESSCEDWTLCFAMVQELLLMLTLVDLSAHALEEQNKRNYLGTS